MFNPIDFLDFSKSLLNNVLNKNEAFYRSIISRSYYSAFLITREKIDEMDDSLLSHGSKPTHEDVIRNITSIPTKELNIEQLKKLKKNLRELKWYRVNADYIFPDACHERSKNFINNKCPTTKTDAEYVIASAENFIKKISKA